MILFLHRLPRPCTMYLFHKLCNLSFVPFPAIKPAENFPAVSNQTHRAHYIQYYPFASCAPRFHPTRLMDIQYVARVRSLIYLIMHEKLSTVKKQCDRMRCNVREMRPYFMHYDRAGVCGASTQHMVDISMHAPQNE